WIRIRVSLRSYSLEVKGGREGLRLIEKVVPRERRLKPQTVVQSQAGADLQRVMDKPGEQNVAVLLERSPTLGERAQLPHQEIGYGNARDIACEAESTILEQMIVLIKASPFESAADGQTVSALHPPDCVVPIESRAGKDGVSELAEAEITRYIE